MLTTLKNELKQREFLAEATELDDEILIDEMDDNILLDDEEDDIMTESSMAEIEKAIDLIPVDDTDLAYEEMDELLEACCSEIEEDAKAEGDEPVQGDPGDDEAVSNEVCKFCDEEDDQDYNIYRGRGVSHAGGYCESDYILEDDEAVSNEVCKFCDEEDDQDYNIYRGRGASHAGGYCESDYILEDDEDEDEDMLEESESLYDYANIYSYEDMLNEEMDLEEDEFEGLSEDMLVSLYFE